ncbi:hypothetical protein HKX48_009038 [Thoreauomyces humboldtii]|nr:hypothetical protein HKX48_009038 [Thoreauomyces humboldtii]
MTTEEVPSPEHGGSHGGGGTHTQEEQLERCLNLLAPQTKDEEKFVALLMLPRLLDPQKNPQSLHICFRRMNWSFIHRMLEAEDTPNLPQEALHSISVNLLSGFVRDKELVHQPELIACIQPLARLLMIENGDTLETILQCLSSLASSIEGALQLAEAVYLEHISALLASQQTNVAGLTLVLLEQLSDVSTREPSARSIRSSLETAVLPVLSSTFAKTQESFKFDCAKLLVGLCCREDLKESRGKELPAWALDIRQGTIDILGSKISSEQRDVAFVLCSAMLRRFGPAWLEAVDEKIDGPDPSSQKRLSAQHFAIVLLHLSGGEVRVLLDETPSDDTLATPSGRLSVMLPVCAEIVELLVRGLFENESLAPDAASSIRQSLSDTMESVRSYLADVSVRMALVQDGDATSILDNVVTASCLRLMSTWIAEDGSLPVAQTRQVVPLLVAAGQGTLTCLDGSTHAMGFLGPALVTVTTDDDLRQEFVSCGGVRMVVDYWKSLSSVDLATASILLNVVLLGTDSVQSDLATWFEAITLCDGSLKDTKMDVVVRAHTAFLAVSIVRALTAAQATARTDVISGVVDGSAAFVTQGIEMQRDLSDPGKEAWEDVKELWGVTVAVLTTLAASTPRGHPMREVPSVEVLRKAVADLDRSPRNGLEKETLAPLVELGRALNR